MNSFSAELDTLMGKWLGRGDDYESIKRALDDAKENLAAHQQTRSASAPSVEES